MVSDIVCECLVKKKADAVHIAKVTGVFGGGFLKVTGVFGGGFLISYELLALASIHDPTGMLGPMLLMVGLFLTVYFGRMVLMIEFEYAYFDGEIAFDRIRAKSKRKHLIDVDLKSVEKMGRPGDEELQKLKVAKIRDYSVSKSDPNTIYIYFKDERTGDNNILFFTPNQKMLDAMKTSVSATVYREFYSKAKKNAAGN